MSDEANPQTVALIIECLKAGVDVSDVQRDITRKVGHRVLSGDEGELLRQVTDAEDEAAADHFRIDGERVAYESEVRNRHGSN